MDENLTILIPAHDSYEDVLKLYMSQLVKNWKDCPYEVIWSNGLSYLENYENLRIVNNGINASFCLRIKNALNQINTKYVLLSIEDFIIYDFVDSNQIKNLLKIMNKNNYLYCKLVMSNTIKYKNYKMIYSDLYEVPSNIPYGCSINCGIFEREFLCNIIQNENWSGWELENYLLMLARGNKLTKCLMQTNNILNVIHLIDKGKIIPNAAKILEKKDVSFKCINREYLSNKDIVMNNLKGIATKHCPSAIRILIKRFFKFLGIRFTTNY